MTTSTRSVSTLATHSIERPAGVVSVHTVFARPLCAADGAAQGVGSVAGPGLFGSTGLGEAHSTHRSGWAVSCLWAEGEASLQRYASVGTCKSVPVRF